MVITIGFSYSHLDLLESAKSLIADYLILLEG